MFLNNMPISISSSNLLFGDEGIPISRHQMPFITASIYIIGDHYRNLKAIVSFVTLDECLKKVDGTSIG